MSRIAARPPVRTAVRTALRVRPATADDLPDLLRLSDELREQQHAAGAATRPRGSGAGARLATEARLREALDDPLRHVVVVVDGPPDGPEEVLGSALLVVAPVNALLDALAVHLSHAVVTDRHRRRGAGRALVAAAVALAEETGVEQVVVSASPGSREANRFFARLGFAPLVVRRIAPVALVRRRLATAEPVAVDHVARRRRRPLRPVRGVLPLGPSREPELEPGAP